MKKVFILLLLISACKPIPEHEGCIYSKERFGCDNFHLIATESSAKSQQNTVLQNTQIPLN